MPGVIVPDYSVFANLPVPEVAQIFNGAVMANDREHLRQLYEEMQRAALETTGRIASAFSPEHMQDLLDRPIVTIVADGATLRTNLVDGEMRNLQEVDGKTAFQLGKMIAERGWRVALPGCEGLCRDIMEGVKAGGGEYIVAVSRRSLRYYEDGTPQLPNGNGIYIITNTPAEAKSALFGLSSHFVFHRGGLGTLDLLSDLYVLLQTEMTRESYRYSNSWRHKLMLLNEDGYWNPALSLTQHIIDDGFASQDHANIMMPFDNIQSIMKRLGEDLYKGKSWSYKGRPDHTIVTTPSMAITLAGKLVHKSVLQQLSKTEPADVIRKLRAARQLSQTPNKLSNTLMARLDRLTSVAVYCGSREGHNPVHMEAAAQIGDSLRRKSSALIYGGSEKGLMGQHANRFLDAKYTTDPLVIAVTPFAFIFGEGAAANEGFHPQTETIGVPGFQERKVIMTSLSRLAVANSGGWGTLDEMIEEVYLNALGVQRKPAIFRNVGGFWDSMPQLFVEPLRRGYINPRDLSSIAFADSHDELEAIMRTGINFDPKHSMLRRMGL